MVKKIIYLPDDDHGPVRGAPEPFYRGPGRPRQSVKTALETSGAESLKIVAESVAEDFDLADSAEARSTLARTLATLINSIRLAEGTEPKQDEPEDDLLDQLRQRRAEGS